MKRFFEYWFRLSMPFFWGLIVMRLFVELLWEKAPADNWWTFKILGFALLVALPTYFSIRNIIKVVKMILEDGSKTTQENS